MHKLRRLLRRCPRLLASWTWVDYQLATSLVIALAVIRLLVMLLPFRHIAALFGTLGRETPDIPLPVSAAEQLYLQKLGVLLPRISHYVPWRSKCLEQALCGLLFLKWRGLSSTLYCGVAKGTTALKAHAWLRHGDQILVGAQGREWFTVVLSVASESRG